MVCNTEIEDDCPEVSLMMELEEPIEKWKAAILEQDVPQVARLFEQNPELKSHVNDQIFAFDRSAVHCCRDNFDMIDLLIDHGADLNLKSGWWAGGFGILEGLTTETAKPLVERGAIVDIWAAVGLNDHVKVRDLLQEKSDRITAKGGDGKHPIHDARDVDMVDLLVASGADVNAKCIDHESTPLQYQVQNRDVVYRLIEHGAQSDVFIAAAHNDVQMLMSCLELEPKCCDFRIGVAPFANNAGGHIYNWTIGHDLTPQQAARDLGSRNVWEVLLNNASPIRQLMDAIWICDRKRVSDLQSNYDNLLRRIADDDRQSLARAAWWYRPKTVTCMLELGFDPHFPGVHNSTPLDRSAFHGYAEIIQTLLEHDPNPPLEVKNEFGGTPLGACLHGMKHGWKTGHPQNYPLSIRLLVEAGSPVEAQHLDAASPEIKTILESITKQ